MSSISEATDQDENTPVKWGVTRAQADTWAARNPMNESTDCKRTRDTLGWLMSQASAGELTQWYTANPVDFESTIDATLGWCLLVLRHGEAHCKQVLASLR